MNLTPPGQTGSQYLVSERLSAAMPGLRHGFTYGLPRLNDPEIARETQTTFGFTQSTPWVFNQPHGPKVLKVHPATPWSGGEGQPASVPVVGYDGGRGQLEGQSDEARGPVFAVKAADCVTVLAVLPGPRAYAALHAGWRGVATRILPELLTAWHAEGGRLADACLALGPHIRSCCFEVKDDCLAQFSQADLIDAVAVRAGRKYLDLERVLRTQMVAFGIDPGQVDALPQCTRCHQAEGRYPFASYRRAQQEGRQAGRNLAFIGPATT